MLTYRRITAEVRLTFSASENQQTRLTALQQSDFVVVDSNAVIRDFRSFARASEMNVDLLILLDCSESVSPQLQRELREVVRLVTETAPLNDEHVSVGSFSGTQAKLLCAGNCRTWSASDSFSRMFGSGSTPLFDAVVFASKILTEKNDPNVRHLLVIFSDGMDTISRHSAGEAIEAALKAEAQIYTVDITGRKDHSSQGADVLKQIANLTGGAYFGIADGATDILQSVLADLRSTYVVTYSLPDRRAGFHEIRILPTHNLNLEFRSRGGYFYPGNH